MILESKSTLVTKREIIKFAKEFDPAFFHLDEKAAKKSILGGLSASGFHSLSLAMRMICDAWPIDEGFPSIRQIEEVNWLAPVRPGDQLTGHLSLTDGSCEAAGTFEFSQKTINQHGMTVMRMRGSLSISPATSGLANG